MSDSISIGVAYRDQKIVGGTVDDTAIGATTASTGAFTTISASGAITASGGVNGAIGSGTPAAGAFTTLNASGATTFDGTVAIGNAASDTVAFYGATKVAQRAFSGAVHATSAQATSASFGATQLATLQEIQLTLIGLGVWASA